MLERTLWLAQPPAEVFPFFGDARNLERITPPWLNFHVLTADPIRMGQGTLIDYRLRLHGVPLRWRTRITVWDPPRRFVDEQVRGPYRVWRHEHRFDAEAGGTRARDRVEYAARGGSLVGLFVRRDLDGIFDFRRAALEEAFGRR